VGGGGDRRGRTSIGSLGGVNKLTPSRAARFAETMAVKAGYTVEVMAKDESGNLTKQSVSLDEFAGDDTRYCVCRRTYAEDCSLMIGCAQCEQWFHVACMRLAPCDTHNMPPVEGGEVELRCLVSPPGEHLDVSSEYMCPGCSGTRWGKGT
jgi:hypothetical protein